MLVDFVPRPSLQQWPLSPRSSPPVARTRAAARIPYDRPLAAPDEPKIQALPQNYKISPLDTLTIKVFKAEDLSGRLYGRPCRPYLAAAGRRSRGREPHHRRTRREADPGARAEIFRKSGCQRRDQAVDGACRHGRRRRAAGGPVSGRWTDDADPGSVALRQGNVGGRKSAPGCGVPDDRRAAAGRGFRSYRDPAGPGERSANLSGRHHRRRRIDDQGGRRSRFFQSVPLLAIFRPF